MARETSDLELLQGIAAGDPVAFQDLFRRWSPRLGRFLERATGCRDTAADLLQETFLRILRAAPRFEPRGSVGAWIYRIGANLAYSHWRRQRPSAPLPPDDGPAMLALSASSADDPARRREGRAFVEAVRRATARLPENQRLVFLLKVDQGLTYEAIAEILGCPVGTAKSRLHLAVRRLRAALGDWNASPAATTARGTPSATVSPHPARGPREETSWPANSGEKR